MKPQITFLLATCLALPAVAAQPEANMANEFSGTAIQAKVDAAAAQGGGVVSLPPGKYVSGPLWLKDGVELHLDTGATVVMSHEATDWPPGVRALVNANGAKNIEAAMMIVDVPWAVENMWVMLKKTACRNGRPSPLASGSPHLWWKKSVDRAVKGKIAL